MIYAAVQLGPKIKLSCQSPQDPDLQVLDIIDGLGNITLINIYNQSRENGPTIQALTQYHLQGSRILLLGDFNLHHLR